MLTNNRGHALWALVGFFVGATMQARADEPLTIADRVAAQREIERLYHAHRVGTRRSFEEAVPHGVAEAKVRTYLKQSVALEEVWETPITQEMLRAEIRRMTRGSRMPDRLQALTDLLGGDPLMLREYLARPLLADRLSRNFYAFDERFHGAARNEAAALRRELLERGPAGFVDDPRRTTVEIVVADHRVADARRTHEAGRVELSPVEFQRRRRSLPRDVGGVGPVRETVSAFVVQVLVDEEPGRAAVESFRIAKVPWDDWWREASASFDETAVTIAPPTASEDASPDGLTEGTVAVPCAPDDTWDNGILDDVPDPRARHVTVWTGAEMVVWGGEDADSQPIAGGGRYDPATDTWTPISRSGAPASTADAIAVWTGSEMVVWGGREVDSPASVGGRYDPATDSWSPISTTDAPAARSRHTGTWTGTRLIIWGGEDDVSPLGTGGAYDPATDSWTAVSAVGAPSARAGHSATWTGSRVVVWGGNDGIADRNTGGRYDPGTDQWEALTVSGAPSSRRDHTAVWTGSRMIVWGGLQGSSTTSSGGLYDPDADAWTATSGSGTPSGRTEHTATWTGTVMIVWGGRSGSSPVNSGGRYDPLSNSWSATTTSGAPSLRRGHGAVWTGDRLVIWGGEAFFGDQRNTGGRYDPASNTWTPTSIGGGPEGRENHTAVWTGNRMIVWGGTTQPTGGQYDPTLDAWTPMATAGAPTGRSGHSAVWTGDLMIVWGGGSTSSPFKSGGRYDPISNSWSAVSLTGAPTARTLHSSVWTGSLMLVWGGNGGSQNPDLGTGGRYDPIRDRWSPMNPWGAPSPRQDATTIWTGTWMVIWGGRTPSFPQLVGTGARYEPVTDTWEPIPTVGSPGPRYLAGGASVGGEAVIWGGREAAGPVATGARWDPVTDLWTPLPTANAPTARSGHGMVTVGSRVMVWGGTDGTDALQSGAIYDPGSDLWEETSLVGAPAARTAHSTIWTGSLLIVWGGTDDVNTGGRYALGHDVDDDGDGFTECEGDCNDAAASVLPGGLEVCNGLDDDCNGIPDDDGDEDGEGLCFDCDDQDPDVQHTPGEVQDLLFVDGTTVSWAPPAAPGGSTIRYDLLRSADATTFLAALCLESDDGSDAMGVDPEVPAIGMVHFYVVRAENDCPLGSGSLGSSSNGAPRAGGACP